MGDIGLHELRGLRDRAEVLNDHLIGDLRAFLHVDPSDPSFRRLAGSKSDFNVTTTSSCLTLQRNFGSRIFIQPSDGSS